MRWAVLCVLAGVAAAASEGQLVKLRHAPGGKLVVPSGANGVHPLLSQVRRKPDLSRSVAMTVVRSADNIRSPAKFSLPSVCLPREFRTPCAGL
jgi:hypothetical protein